MEDNEERLDNDPPRSRESTQRVYIRFLNLTNRIIEILWVNFTGQYVRYQLLGKNSYGNIDTFKTHPWIAQDLHTKDRMWLDKSYLYMPQTTQEHFNNLNQQNPNIVCPIPAPELRKLVLITFPMLSLRYRTLLALRDVFAQPELVDELELPRDLKEDLKKVITLRNRRLATSALTVSGS